jgi:hypothetical protein
MADMADENDKCEDQQSQEGVGENLFKNVAG